MELRFCIGLECVGLAEPTSNSLERSERYWDVVLSIGTDWNRRIKEGMNWRGVEWKGMLFWLGLEWIGVDESKRNRLD